MFNRVKNIILRAREGQALVELMVGVAIGGLILGSSAAIITVVLQSNDNVAKSRAATELAQELIDDVRVYSDQGWGGFYNLANTSSNHFHIASTTPVSIVSGDEIVTRNNEEYTRYFYMEDVKRATSGDAITTSGGTLDPSSQKIVVNVSWEGGEGLTFTEYFTRYRNFVFHQNDWSGGSDTTTAFTKENNSFSGTNGVSASTTGQLKLDGF